MDPGPAVRPDFTHAQPADDSLHGREVGIPSAAGTEYALSGLAKGQHGVRSSAGLQRRLLQSAMQQGPRPGSHRRVKVTSTAACQDTTRAAWPWPLSA